MRARGRALSGGLLTVLVAAPLAACGPAASAPAPSARPSAPASARPTSSPAAVQPSSPGVIYTVAGNGQGGFSGDGGPALSARLNQAFDVAFDPIGNLFIADWSNNRVRRVDPVGIITTVAGGGRSGFLGDGGPATLASLNQPGTVGADSQGNVYVTEWGANRVRKVTPDGVITTFAGTGVAGFSGDGGPAAAARLNQPSDVVVDAQGSVYIADWHNNRIRKVDTRGIITTVAGSGAGGFGGDGGPALAAQLGGPEAIAVDGAGDIFVVEYALNRLREVDAHGIIRTVAGTGPAGYSGDGGLAPAASLNEPSDVVAAPGGVLYVADFSNFVIRRIDATGHINTFAGDGRQGTWGDGGPATSAALQEPGSIDLDAQGNLYIADGNRVREINIAGNLPLAWSVPAHASSLQQGQRRPAQAQRTAGRLDINRASSADHA